ncbi:MAG: MBL fold metallo-hydrolase [Candidatus Marinimicrobia bacterium]|jgi:L-ascorbate metabolism protein UlaG (beta-lactamase superfamily)|nr:MBL fold metallo-hydrolase [Candidatus Neomarinimicrobiota bacterium]
MDLLQKIEKQNVMEGQLEIYFIGQSGYVLKTNNSTIYIDPYLSDYIENPEGLNERIMTRNYSPPFNPGIISKCDAIICTHAHIDHMDPWTLKRIKPKFQLFTSIGAYEKSIINFPKSRVTFLTPQKPCNIASFKIISFPAAHYELRDEKGRPDCLSILIQWQNKFLFFWGDGIGYEGQFDLLSSFNFDYFFAPINGRDIMREKMGIIGNIKEDELAALCSKLSIEHIIPNHYDMFKNNTGSVASFQGELKKRNPNQSVIIMKCGDMIEL